MTKLILQKITNQIDISKEIKAYNYFMKKTLFKKSDLDIIGIVLRKMLPDPKFSLLISAESAIELLQNNLVLNNISSVNITIQTIKNWLDKGVIRGTTEGEGKTSRYKIVKDDITNLCEFFGVSGFLQILGLREKKQHPESEIEVIMQYTPLQQFRAGLTVPDVELLSVIDQLKNSDILRYIQEAIAETTK